MSDYSQSRSNYLKIMNGNLNKRLASLNPQQTINQVNDTSYDSMALETYTNQVNTSNLINSAKSQIEANSTATENKDRNWWQQLTDTFTDIQYSIEEGLLNFADSIGDFFFNTAIEIGKNTGADTTWAENSRDYDWQARALKGMNLLNPTNAWNGDMFTSEYWTDWNEENIREQMQRTYDNSFLESLNPDIHKFTYQMGNTFGNMIPSIVTGQYVGQLASASQSGQLVSLFKPETWQQIGSLSSMGFGAFASKANEAYEETGDYGRAIGAGLASASVEVASEIFVGKGLEAVGIGNGKVFGFIGGKDGGTTKVGAEIIKDIVKSFNEEGIEEVASGLLEPLVNSIYQGTDAFKSEEGKANRYLDTSFWFGGEDSIAMQYVAGGVMGGLGDAITSVNSSKTFTKEGSRGLKILDENRDLQKQIAKEKDATKKAKLQEQYAANVVEAEILIKKGLESAKANQKTNLLEALTNPTEFQTVSQKTQAEQQSFLETRLNELKDVNKANARNLFNDLEGRFGKGYTLEFSDELKDNDGNDVNGQVNHKTNTITINSKYAEQYASTITHEYLGHAIGNGLSSQTINSMFNKVIKTKWFENNSRELRKAYQEVQKAGESVKWQQEVVNKYLESVFDSDEKVSDVFLQNTLLNRLNAFFNKENNLNILRNNAIANEFVKSIDNILKITKDKQFRKILDKIAKGKFKDRDLTQKERAYLEKYGDIAEAYIRANNVEYSKAKEKTDFNRREFIKQSNDIITEQFKEPERVKSSVTLTKKELSKLDNFAEKYMNFVEKYQNEIWSITYDDKSSFDELLRYDNAIRDFYLDFHKTVEGERGSHNSYDLEAYLRYVINNNSNFDEKTYSNISELYDFIQDIKDQYAYVNSDKFLDLKDNAWDKKEQTQKSKDNKNDTSNNTETKKSDTQTAKLSFEQKDVSKIKSSEVQIAYADVDNRTQIIELKSIQGKVIDENIAITKSDGKYVINDIKTGYAVRTYKAKSYQDAYNQFIDDKVVQERYSNYVNTKRYKDLVKAFNDFKSKSSQVEQKASKTAKTKVDKVTTKVDNVTTKVDNTEKKVDEVVNKVHDENAAVDILMEGREQHTASKGNTVKGKQEVMQLQFDVSERQNNDVLDTEHQDFESGIEVESLEPYETNKATQIKEGTQEKTGKMVTLKSTQDVYDYVEKVLSRALGREFTIVDKNGKARRLFEEYNISSRKAKRSLFRKFANDILHQNINDIFKVEDVEVLPYTLEEYLTIRNIDVQQFAQDLGDAMYELLSTKAVDTKAQIKMNKLMGYINTLLVARAELQATNSFIKKIYNIKNNIKKAMESKVGSTGQMHLTQGIADMFNKFFNKLDFTTKGYTSSSNLKNLHDLVEDGTFNNMIDSLLNPNSDVELTDEMKARLEAIKAEAKELANEYREVEKVHTKGVDKGKPYKTHAQPHLTFAQTIALRTLCEDVYKAYRDYSIAVKESTRKQAQGLINAVSEVAARSWNLSSKQRSAIKAMLNYMSPKQFYGFVFGGTDTPEFKSVWNDIIVKSYSNQLGKFVEFLKARDEFIKNINKKRFNSVTLKDGTKVKRYALYQFYLNTLAPDNDIRMRNGGITYTDKVTKTLSYEQMEEAVSNLTKEELADLNGIFNIYNTTLRQYLGDMSLKNFGFEVMGRDNYYPIAVSDITRNKDYTSGNSINPNPNAVTNNHLKNATNTKSVVELNIDPMELYEQYVKSMTISGEIGLASQKLNRLWNLKAKDGKTLKQVASQFVPDIDEYITYSMNQLLGYSNNASNRALSFLMGNYATAKLALNQRSVLKQFASFATAMGQLGFWKSMKVLLNPSSYSQLVANRNKIKENNIYKMRVYENGAIKAATFGHQFSSVVTQKMAKLGLWAMEHTDRLTCLLTYSLARGTVIAENENLSEAEIDAIANERFTNLILDTQSNADRIVMSRIRSGDLGSIPKYLFGMFGSDAQNKAGQWFEALNNAKNAAQSKDSERIKSSSKYLGSVVAGTILSALIASLADLLADWLYDKEEPEDFNLVERSLALLTNATLDWFPYLSSMVNWYKYDGASIGGLDLINEVLSAVQNLTDGDISKSDRTKIFMKLGELFGIPTSNLEKLIVGTLGNFNPELALKYKNLFYGISQTTLSTQVNNYISSGKLTRAVAPMTLNYSLYKFAIDDNVSSEIVNVKANGGNISIKNVPETINDVTLTESEVLAFKEIYSQAGTALTKMVADRNYQKLDYVSKAKVLNKISDIFYELAKYKVTNGTSELSRLAKIVSATNSQFDYQKIVAAIVIANNSDNAVKALNSTTGLTRVEKLLALRLAGKSITDTNKESVNKYLKSLGMSSSAIEALW